MEELGQNGFAVADSRVDSYVGFISDLARRSDHVATTCVVRPYWFVVDEIQEVALPPFVNKNDEYGKGEHLRCFESSIFKRHRYQRCLIVDELMLADVLLSAMIDVTGTSAKTDDCPCCQGPSINRDCPFHGRRYPLADPITDVPEIWWFSEQVNKERGVTLIYTFVGSAWRDSRDELQDRVFASSDGLNLDLRFTFTSLERGTMRLRWADEARHLAKIEKFSISINPETGDNDKHGHKFYQTFAACMGNKSANEAMIRSVQALHNGVQEHFTTTNVSNIGSSDKVTLQNYLGSGSPAMQQFILRCIDKLSVDLKSGREIATIYGDLVRWYNDVQSVSRIAHVVALDLKQPLQPVRVARWDQNWKGILNAPG
jgi:hypothetical protein